MEVQALLSIYAEDEFQQDFGLTMPVCHFFIFSQWTHLPNLCKSLDSSGKTETG